MHANFPVCACQTYQYPCFPLPCRDQIDRLTEILYSRAADLSNFEREKKNPIVNTGREAEGNLNAHEISRKSVEVKLDLNRSIWGVSTPLPSSTVSGVDSHITWSLGSIIYA